MSIRCAKVTFPKLPSGSTRGAALGFCDGQPVARVEAARKPSVGCWWPDGVKPQMLTYEDRPGEAGGGGSGNVIPGSYRPDKEGESLAVAWISGKPVLLHSAPFERSWVSAAAGDLIVGGGLHRPHPKSRLVNGGWYRRGERLELLLPEEHDLVLQATDGQRLGGSYQARAALWPAPEQPHVDLAPPKTYGSEVNALDGDYQFGRIWKGFVVRAAMWQGSAESFQDLTPKGFETAEIAGAAGGVQVGSVRPKNDPTTDNRAWLWRGHAQDGLDLQEFLPQRKYNASRALAVCRRGSEILVCGEANLYEGQAVSKAHPVVWHLVAED